MHICILYTLCIHYMHFEYIFLNEYILLNECIFIQNECIFIFRQRESMGDNLIATLIMAHIIFFSKTPFPHSQREIFAHSEFLRLTHQNDCMECWKVSLLISRKFGYIVSHCASLSPPYYSSSSLLPSVSFHLSVVLYYYPVFPHSPASSTISRASLILVDRVR